MNDHDIECFLISEGVDPEEFACWIDCYRSESPGMYDSFPEYYEISVQQMQVFSSVDWEGTDNEVEASLYNAYSNAYD